MTFAFANSTLFRVMAPTIFVLCILSVAMAGFSYWQAKHLYQELQTENLTSFLNTSRNVLAQALPQDASDTPVTERVIRNSLKQTSLPQGVGLFVLSPAGRIYYQKGTGSEDVVKPHMGYFLKQADSASHALITAGGETIVGMNMPSRSLFLVIYSQNTFAKTPQSQKILIQVFVIVPLAIFAAILLLLITLHFSLFRPLLRLAGSMRQVLVKQDFSIKATEQGSAEIKELSVYFNEMLAGLKKRDKSLKSYSKDLEEQVKARTKELENAQKKIVLHERLAAIGEFASSIVHELRNPLSAIKLGIERLNMQTSDEKNKRSLKLTKREVNRLDDMLKGILDFAANRPTKPERLSLKAVFNDIEPHLIAIEENHAVKIVRPQTDKPVFADKTKLEQVLINILKNAGECAPEQSEIQVTYRTINDALHIYIKNTGEPLPEGVKSRLFEPFYTTKKGGTGLGLPTSKKLMEEMNGHIGIKSKGSQTTVTLTLPQN